MRWLVLLVLCFGGVAAAQGRTAVGYRKGKAFPIELVSIDGAPIERTTANAFWAMRDAAAKDGVELTIYSAFRSPREQEYFYQCYRTCSCNGCSRLRAVNRCSPPPWTWRAWWRT